MKKLLVPLYLFSCNAVYAAGGFGKATSALTSFQSDLLTIVRIIAVIALIIIGAMWLKGMASARTLLNWFIGVIIVGCANEIVSYFL